MTRIYIQRNLLLVHVELLGLSMTMMNIEKKAFYCIMYDCWYRLGVIHDNYAHSKEGFLLYHILGVIPNHDAHSKEGLVL